MGGLLSKLPIGGLAGVVAKKLFGKKKGMSAEDAANKVADEREAKRRKIAANTKAQKNPNAVYQGTTTPVSTLMSSGKGRSGY